MSLLILFCNRIYIGLSLLLTCPFNRTVHQFCCDFICPMLLFQGHVTSWNLTPIGPDPSHKNLRLKSQTEVERYKQHQGKAILSGFKS